MMNRKRIGVLLVCVGLVIALSASVFYIAHEAHHDCCGEGCPVCGCCMGEGCECCNFKGWIGY